MGQLVGLSLLFCIRDIAEGRVREGDVEKIVAGTEATRGQWDDLLDLYESYWEDFPEAKAIATRLRAAGKIEQPRLRGGQAPNIAKGHWLVNGKQTRIR